MGSGKSTLGPIVANVLGYDFVDLDVMIAERAGRSVQAIFAEDGEEAFRALEAACLQETGQRERLVVSVGGGALTFEDNLQWALANGTVVYLKVPARVLAHRLFLGRSVRPLLLDAQGRPLSASALRQKVQTMLDQREPFYRQAHIIIKMGEQHVGQTVDEVVRAVRRYRRRAQRADGL